ncbi:MAG: O-antigen ligase family protein [Bacteroidales bacterium]|nr:O-antigen ligase family protein [Bacteroidales bacterium]
MTERIKIAWVYLLSAVFLAVSLYFLIRKDTYLAFSLPLVLGILLLYVFSIDKVMLLVGLLTPLSINIEDMDVGLGISLPVEPMLFGVMVLFFIKLLHERKYDRRIAAHPIAVMIYLMFSWILITTMTSEFPLVSAKFFISRLWFVVPSFFVGAIMFKKPENISRFIWLYNIGLIFVIAYTIARHASFGFNEKSAHWVMSPLYNDHTAYGAALAIFLILTAGYLFMPGLGKWRRLFVIAMIVLLTIATVLSLSRAAWISIAGAIGVLILVLFRIRLRWIILSFGTVIALFFTFQHQIIDALEKNKQDSSADLVEHVQSISNISSDASNLERINRWQAALRLYHERPFFGWGPGTYQFVYGPFQRSKEKTIISTNVGDKGNAHSEYIGPLSEMGMPGMLIVITLVGVMIFRGIKAYQKNNCRKAKVISLSATLALVSYFIHGLLNNFLDTDKLAVPVWACMAMIVVMDIYGDSLFNDTAQPSQSP